MIYKAFTNPAPQSGNPPSTTQLHLSSDLDQVWEELFSITISGGDEYCGQVIGQAINHLDWSQNKNDLRVISIAGNEPFNQGPIDDLSSYPRAKEKGIINTIHCGTAFLMAGLQGRYLQMGKP